MPTMRITKSEVDKTQSSDKVAFFWDSTLSGFGLKVSPNGVKSYVVQYRTAGGRGGQVRRVTIGRHGSPWTPETARTEAKRLLGHVAHGADPAQQKRNFKEMPTVSELCDTYLRDGTGTKKPSTLATDSGRIERHIKPLLGKRKVSEVTQADIRKFLKNVADGATATVVETKLRGRAIVKGGKGTATRTLGLLGGIFTYAVERGLIATNPVHGVKRYADRKNERFLGADEITKLGKALRDAEGAGTNQKAIDIIRLLILTGARRGEIERLKRSEVDIAGGRIRLDDSKTGQKSLPLNTAAAEILASLVADKAEQKTYVFPSSDDSDSYYEGTPKVWAKLREDIGMGDVRLHDLRHSFASVGVSSGTPLMVIGALLGHADHATTQRYAHLSANPIAAAAEIIGASIKRSMDGTPLQDAANSEATES